MKYFKIGYLSKALNISNDTIRLYEKYNLLNEPLRAENGYRQYSQDDISRLKFIIKAKTMGFTLGEISELLHIKNTSPNACNIIRNQAQEKLDSAVEKIEQLQQLKNALQLLIDNCDEPHPDGTCPIVSYFESANNTKIGESYE